MQKIKWAVPATIGILMEIYTRGVTSGAICSKNSETECRAIAALKEDGLIDIASLGGDKWRTTNRGQVFIKMLVDTPLPDIAYLDPRTEKPIKL